MTSFTFTIQGDRELVAKLRKFGLTAVNMTQTMDDVGRYLTSFFSGEVFASRGRVIGKAWAPLTDAYAAAKAREFPGRPPLVRTGLMQRSFKHKSTMLSTRIHNEASYFDEHQGGTRYMPARVMMRVDQARAQAIVKLISDGLAEKMRQAGV